MTPASYGARGKGATIRYTIVPCDLGNLLVAATERGICAAGFSDHQAELEQALRSDYGHAVMTRDDSGLAATVQAVLHHLHGPAEGPVLDVRATDFQRRVWELLCAIPRGTTRTYAELARLAGRPGAERAVGAACAANKVALLVPCHRVLRSDGALGGYRWGLERKAELLRREKSKG